MTYRIRKSAIAGIVDFPAQAAAFAVEMKGWRAHMARVAEDEKNGVTGADKHWPLQRPGGHPMVEAAVNENGDMDYELVDDGPSADQILRAKKDVLLGTVHHLEVAAIAAIVPLGKRRLLNMREDDIVRKANTPIGLLAKAGEAVGITPKKREISPADQRHLDEQSERREKIASIERAAAQAHSDIEDLTLETIDAWQAPTFT